MKYDLGSTFPDSVTSSSRRMKRSVTDDEVSDAPLRVGVAILIFLVGITILWSRMFFLMVVQGKRYASLAAGNRVRETVLRAARGIIYDRNGVPLVRNTPMFLSPDHESYFDHLPEGDTKGWVQQIAREYINGSVFSHVIGYVGEVNESQVTSGKGVYEPGDMIGMLGVEQSYDAQLRGVNGKELMETDALGERVRTLGTIQPVDGQTLTLTVEKQMQIAAAAALGDLRGAVVASIPATGEVLVLYSSPSFDPNDFIHGNISSLLTRTDQPLFFRAISGQYPPGSTFKIVTAVAGLESKKISPQTIVEDTGVLKVGAFSFGNWYFSQYGRVEGPLTVVGALKRSNDIFFYKAAEATGIETIAGWAKNFGLGKPMGIDLTGEEGGIMPDPEWTKRVKKEPWYLGNTYHVAIGQGDVLATPLQVNSWANVIATRGYLCTPHVVKRNRYDPVSQCRDLEIHQETMDLVREGMKEACAEGGTGWPLFHFSVKNKSLKPDGVDFFPPVAATGSADLTDAVGIPVACKTGTAEIGDPQGKTHAWFTAFAPIEHPQISVTVLVEKGGEGSTNAAPIAKKVLEAWFGR